MKPGDIILIPAEVIKADGKRLTYKHDRITFTNAYDPELIDRVTIGVTPYDTAHRCGNGGTWPMCIPSDQ